MKSFSNLVKEEISQINKQKLCCSFSFLYGIFSLTSQKENNFIAISTNAENKNAFLETCKFINSKKRIEYNIEGRNISIAHSIIRFFTIAEIEENIFKCQHCRENFLKAIFLTYGSISDPQKMYRLDICLNSENHSIQLNDMLYRYGLNFKNTKRKNKYILYTKDSDCIADFLATIGANSSVYEIINSKIEKELRNEVNRVTNCDSANINKTVQAAQKYCVVIENIISEGLFDELPDNLKLMAKMRLEFENLNFADLGKKFNPQISKSGVYHRLEKIIAFYEKAKELKNKE